MNWIEMLSVLRQDPRWRELPVMLYTDLSDAALAQAVEKLGVHDLIVKEPLDGSALLNRIADRLPPSLPN